MPYAFGFRDRTSENLDFVLISVHLKPGDSSASAARRKHELASIHEWIDDHDEVEKDFIILGDMNIEDAEELSLAMPADYQSLNAACLQTNTNVNGPKPYDHVMVHGLHTTEVDSGFGFLVIDLLDQMASHWDSDNGAYPGRSPYVHNTFRQYYSDHHPVVFRLDTTEADDD